MLSCDQCGEKYPNEDVYLSDQGQFRCAYCLGFKSPHPLSVEGRSPLDTIVIAHSDEREAQG